MSQLMSHSPRLCCASGEAPSAPLSLREHATLACIPIAGVPGCVAEPWHLSRPASCVSALPRSPAPQGVVLLYAELDSLQPTCAFVISLKAESLLQPDQGRVSDRVSIQADQRSTSDGHIQAAVERRRLADACKQHTRSPVRPSPCCRTGRHPAGRGLALLFFFGCTACCLKQQSPQRSFPFQLVNRLACLCCAQ